MELLQDVGVHGLAQAEHGNQDFFFHFFEGHRHQTREEELRFRQVELRLEELPQNSKGGAHCHFDFPQLEELLLGRCLVFLKLMEAVSKQNKDLDNSQTEKASQILLLLRKIHKGHLSSSKLASLETATHKVFKTEKPDKFVKLKSCLEKPERGKEEMKPRIEWMEKVADDSREIDFDILEVDIPKEICEESSFYKEKKGKKENSKRKAESHDLKRKKDSSLKSKKNEKKKNYSSKKEKLRKEIAKYFYNSEILIPGKENYISGQRRFKVLTKETLKNKYHGVSDNPESTQEKFKREKFFYKKKLKQKQR